LIQFDLSVIIVSTDVSSSLPTAKTKGSQVCYCGILRKFISRDKFLILRAFLVYVRPILKYSSIIWSPYDVSDIDVWIWKRALSNGYLAQRTEIV